MSERVLFRVAAGPRIGFGHLMRAASLARAMDVTPLVSIRGTRATARAARRLGFIVAGPIDAALRQFQPALLVIDDPSAAGGAVAVRAARRRDIATASVHDLGIAPCASDLSVDGSIVPGRMDLAGPRFAILHPEIRQLALRATGRVAPAPAPTAHRVVIAFGGGPRSSLAARVARELARRRGDVQIDIASGFRPAGRPCEGKVRLLAATAFRPALAQSTVAVLGGGVTLYEACALGVPAVAVSLTAGQRRTVEAMARAGAALDAGAADAPRTARRAAIRAAALVDELLHSPDRRRRVSRAGRRLVDGLGAARVARAFGALASGAERAA